MEGLTSVWKGSRYTAKSVAGQIAARFGEAELNNYDPLMNCFTFHGWKQRGYFVKKGEKAIKSITFIKVSKLNADTGEIERHSYPKNVCLFYIKQVEKRS